MSNSGWFSPPGVSAIAAVIFAFIAFFKDTLLKWWNRPKLRAELRRQPPDTSLIYDSGGYPLLYFRLRVWNDGRTAADKVEVYAKKLQKKKGEELQDLTDFLPMNLTWSHLPRNENIYLPTIPPQTFKHCDLGHIEGLSFDVDSPHWKIVVRTNALFKNNPDLNASSKYFVLNKPITANNYENYLPKGEYLLTLVLSAANSKPREIKIRIIHNGMWFEELEKFLTEGSFVEII